MTNTLLSQKICICCWGVTAYAFTALLVLADASAADGQPLDLKLSLDGVEVRVGDPIFAKICLANPNDHVEVIPGATLPTVGGGSVGVDFRQVGETMWTRFTFNHVIVEPGFTDPRARVEMAPRQQWVYYECIAYRNEMLADNSRTVQVSAIWQPGDYEFRAVAVLGKLILHSAPVRVKGLERWDAEMAAIDLGEKLLQKAVTPNQPGLSVWDNEQSQKLQKYLGDSRAAWLLKWKSAWATWLQADDNYRPKAARDLLIAMRDQEKGIAREILTLSLARAYLSKGNLAAARKEAESLPPGSYDRLVLLLHITQGEKNQAIEILP